MVLGLWRKIRDVGPVAEPAPPGPAGGRPPPAVELGGSVQIRHVDAGSCNGCEIEIASAFGPVTRNMEVALRRTYDAVPAPKLVAAIGDCARNCGVFVGAYAVTGAVGDVIPVDLEVPGCPPRPEAIVEALRTVTGR